MKIQKATHLSGHRASVKQKTGIVPIWGFLFFHFALFSLLAMSQMQPQPQSWNAAAVQTPKVKSKPIFLTRRTMDQKMCKEPPLCFSYHFIMKTAQVLQNYTTVQAHGTGYNSEGNSIFPSREPGKEISRWNRLKEGSKKRSGKSTPNSVYEVTRKPEFTTKLHVYRRNPK